jgi:putative MATE family efflux protein
MFGASEESLYYAKSYINIILLGTIFNVLAFALNSTIRGDGNPRLAATIMVVGCATNIVLDAVLIFGFNMGIKGAAIATVISQFITATWGILYYAKGKSNLKINKNNFKLDKNIVKMIISIGIAPFSMQIAASCVQIISNNALKTYGGDLAIAAMATINSIITLVGMPIIGLSQGAQPIIGYNYGSKNFDRTTKTLKICIVAATLGLSIGWMIVQFIPEPLVALFNNDEELIKISVDGIRKYLSCMPLIGMAMIGSNYVQSIGKAKEAMFLSLLRQVILLVPMMLILPKFMGLNGVWYAQPIADVISFIVTLILIIKEVKSQNVDEDLEIAL